ncbi:hypothetical protein J2S92_003167 [Arthrobacter bambusae]|nr:hypothetical protein [Arthrobacter bambusae]MDQ0236926.1 hypothetical protein [Arthrobacter bambusae]
MASPPLCCGFVNFLRYPLPALCFSDTVVPFLLVFGDARVVSS